MSKMTLAEKVVYDVTHRYPDLCFSFGHIVFDDGNMWDSSIDIALEKERIEEWIAQKIKDGMPEHRATEIALAGVEALQYIKTIPEDERGGN